VTDKTRRRDLMRPVQLVGIAFIAAAFAGLVTAMAMGAWQEIPGEDVLRAWAVAGIVAGIAFIAMLLILSLLMLAIDPAEVEKPIDGPVLMRNEPRRDDDESTPDGDARS